MMETPNLMDVPTHATRRIERYGVLALILFLTTFGVLYLWDGPGEETPNTDTVLAGGAPWHHRMHLIRTARALTATDTGFAVGVESIIASTAPVCQLMRMRIISPFEICPNL